jgi:hypothetical protein
MDNKFLALTLCFITYAHIHTCAQPKSSRITSWQTEYPLSNSQQQVLLEHLAHHIDRIGEELAILESAGQLMAPLRRKEEWGKIHSRLDFLGRTQKALRLGTISKELKDLL